MLGAACHTRRPRRTRSARRTVVRLEEDGLGVRSRSALAEQGVLNARGGQVCPRCPDVPAARSTSASRVSALVSGSRSVPRRRRAAADFRSPLATSSACESGEGLGKGGRFSEGEAVGVAGGSGPPAGELEIAEQRLHVGGALGAAAGGHGESHRGDRARHIATELAEVGDARV